MHTKRLVMWACLAILGGLVWAVAENEGIEPVVAKWEMTKTPGESYEYVIEPRADGTVSPRMFDLKPMEGDWKKTRAGSAMTIIGPVQGEPK